MSASRRHPDSPRQAAFPFEQRRKVLELLPTKPARSFRRRHPAPVGVGPWIALVGYQPIVPAVVKDPRTRLERRLGPLAGLELIEGAEPLTDREILNGKQLRIALAPENSASRGWLSCALTQAFHHPALKGAIYRNRARAGWLITGLTSVVGSRLAGRLNPLTELFGDPSSGCRMPGLRLTTVVRLHRLDLLLRQRLT
jgi:hypothetical protein